MDRFNIIEYVAKKTSKSILLILSVFFIFLILLLSLGKYMILSLFYGVPTVSSISEIASSFDQDKRVVRLKIKELVDIGYEVETINTENGRETSRNTTSFYCVAVYEDGFILVELPYSYRKNPDSKYTNIILKGMLKEPNPSRAYHKEVYDYLAEILSTEAGVSLSDAKQSISPVFLNVDETSTEAYVLLYVVIGLLFIILFFIIKSIRSIFNYTLSGVYKSLEIYGDPEYIEEDILNEYEDGDLIFDGTKGCILKTYIIANKVYLTEDLIWVYTRRSSYNYVIVIHSLVLNFVDGRTIDIRLKGQDEANEAMYYISKNLPVFVGFDAEYQNLFKKKNRDRFIELLEEYKLQFNQKN